MLDKVGRLFLIGPSNHNLAKLESVALTLFSSCLEIRNAGMGVGLSGRKQPQQVVRAGPACKILPAGVDGSSSCGQGAGQKGVSLGSSAIPGPEWGLQRRGQNGDPPDPSIK